MRLALTIGAAIIALGAVTASAQQGDHERIIIRHHGPDGGHGGGDTNEDGYLTRDEAAAHADQMFAELDSNDDGRLDREDRREHVMHFSHGPGAPGAPNADDPNCERTESGEAGNRQITIICRTESGATDDRTVIIRRSDGGGEWTREDMVAPVAPVPPVPPVAGMFIELGEESEADINGDGALSREEFRAQQLRFFDARDVNGDRRVRAPRPPEPPVAPEAPRPPEPPRRR